MRQQKLLTRWRVDDEKQEQQTEGRHALKKLSGRRIRFWRRRRESESPDHADRATDECASPLAHGLF